MESSKINSSGEVGEETRDILPGGVPETHGVDLFQELNHGESEIEFEIHDVETFGSFINDDENAADIVRSEQFKNEELIYVDVDEDSNFEYTYQLVGTPSETNKKDESETESGNNHVDIGVRFLDMITVSDNEEDDENEDVNVEINRSENCPIGALIKGLLPNNTNTNVNDESDNSDNMNIESENHDSTDNGSGYPTQARGMLESMSAEEILENLNIQAPDNVNVATTSMPYYEAMARTTSHSEAAALASGDVEKSKNSKNTNEDSNAAKTQNPISKPRALKENTDIDCHLVRPVKKRMINKELKERVLRNDTKNDENDEFLEPSDDNSEDIDYQFEDDQDNHSEDSSSEESAIQLITRSSIAMKDRKKNQKNHHKKAQMGACISESDFKEHTDAENDNKKPSSGTKRSSNLVEKRKKIRKVNEHRAMEKKKDIMEISDANIEVMRKSLVVLEKRGKATITKKTVKKLAVSYTHLTLPTTPYV